MYDRPFRWWVQSVMPLVFDDSLSYYEVLAKLTKYIEGLTGDVEQIEKILATIEGIEDVTQFTEMLERIQAEIGNLNNLQTDTKASLVSAINEVALKADIAYWKPPTGIPESDLSQEVKDKLNKTGEATKYIINNVELKAAPNNNSPTDLGLGTYSVPSGGIPWDTLSQDVKDRINAGGGGSGGTSDYTELINKPQINGHTLNAGNNTNESLGLGTYSKPDGGIPESDLSAEVQEKLNTSGGIADSQQTFVASRDYEAGELVYINGVLYRTKYKILAGTNMIPGNNIETTDISSELEKINSDIDALQSGAGPDSWNLTTTVQSFSYLEKVDFFEYFNCIGGESYSFIVEPVNPSTAMPYILEIRKRDGTVVLTQTVTDATEYTNRKRFTFIPNDSGEYYCTFYRNASGYTSDLSAVKVTIEYTQSQGISELWAQVNAAAELEPRVSAVEGLVSQQQTALAQLDGIPARMTAAESDIDNLESQIINETDGVINAEQVFTASLNEGGDLRINEGGINNSGGDTNLTTRCRTRYFDVVGNRRYMVKLLDDNYVMMKSFQYGTPPRQTTMLEEIPLTDERTIIFNAREDAYFVRISFARVDTSETVTEEDRANILAALKLYSLTDTSLTQSGTAADAKVTGDKIAENREIIDAHAAQQNVSIDGVTIYNWYMTVADGTVTANVRGRFFYIPCVKNTLYRIDHSKSERFIVGCFTSAPVLGAQPTKYVMGSSADAQEESTFILTESDSAYLGVYYYSGNYSGGWSDTEAFEALSVYTDGVDATLEHEGVAADAKAVGDKISELVRIGLDNKNYYDVPDDVTLVTTYEDVIGLYDALVSEYPDFVSKNTLTNGTFSNYEYVFTIGNYNVAGRRSRDAVIAKPKVLVTTGTHGYERTSVMSLYKFVKTMCENAYDIDDVIYFPELHVIPVVCPWGYTNNSRVNENGVNINRNFATSDWVLTPTGDDYSGAAAGDQNETQIVQSWLVANDDAVIYIDWHNSNFTNEISCLLGANDEDSQKIKHNYLYGINHVIPYWQRERGIDTDNIYAYTGNSTTPGTAKGYGSEQGIDSFTMETSWNVKNTGRHSNFSIGTGAESFGNTLKGIRDIML